MRVLKQFRASRVKPHLLREAAYFSFLDNAIKSTISPASAIARIIASYNVISISCPPFQETSRKRALGSLGYSIHAQNRQAMAKSYQLRDGVGFFLQSMICLCLVIN